MSGPSRIRPLRDRALPPSIQDGFLRNLGADPGGTVEVVDLDAGHDATVSWPADLAALVDGVAARS